MSFTIRKLNADTSFLFVFSNDQDNNVSTATGFRVLVDPWLTGDSSWLHPSFQKSSHTIAPAITSLRDLQNDIDLILISQDKPDHCHQATLCSWPKEKSIAILATPAAAKKIKGWNHFDPRAVHTLLPYDTNDARTLRTIRAVQGIEELTLANLVSRKDVTGLHNAIAITYHPDPANAYHGGIDQASLITPPDSPRTSRSQELPPQTLRARIKSYSSLRSLARRPRTPIVSPPLTPDDRPYVSCIYTPHGVSPALVAPYAQHLSAIRALPLSLLVHSMTVETNPWFMGGVVAAGAPGGLELIKAFNGRVKCWLSAHDEEKDNTGVSVKLLKTHKFQSQEVESLLQVNNYGNVKVAILDPGEEIVVPG